MITGKTYQDYKNKLQDIADIRFAAAVLQWDQETYLPVKGAAIRGRQIATLNSLAHTQFTDPAFGSLLNELFLHPESDPREHKNIQRSLEDHNRAKKLPPEFVRKLSETTNKSFHAWIKARKENDFKIFEGPLSEIIQLKKEEAEWVGYENHPYDALMDEYDKGLTVSFVDKLFERLRPGLTEILNKISKFPEPDDSMLKQHYPREMQWAFGMELLKRIHFDLKAGRQDISEHPFTINFNNNDVRVTTRINEDEISSMTWSCLHEGGHALYEQGLPSEEYGLPLGESCSLSIHESQSRLWENCVGRSLSFWSHNLPLLKQYFPNQLKEVSLERFYNAINKVKPSLIRTEADELTYHFHIMIRYELEKKLMDGTLEAKEIPSFWNESYEKYLGIKVPDDKQGCLQDVHWSHGSFGYFPTYCIGSLYASQFYASIMKKYPGLNDEISKGNNLPVWEWLKQHIYQYGRYYNSDELCRKATGESLDPIYFLNYAENKISDIYQLKF